mmetsp:Transcript_20426/g.41820  ORF Transcript_20426/g.41820 Transcript_20426/m.41820 type:complete len:361 (+) Transcript_20426:1281-2363(+)
MANQCWLKLSTTAHRAVTTRQPLAARAHCPVPSSLYCTRRARYSWTTARPTHSIATCRSRSYGIFPKSAPPSLLFSLAFANALLRRSICSAFSLICWLPEALASFPRFASSTAFRASFFSLATKSWASFSFRFTVSFLMSSFCLSFALGNHDPAMTWSALSLFSFTLVSISSNSISLCPVRSMSSHTVSNTSSSKSSLGPASKALRNSSRDRVPCPVESKLRKNCLDASAPFLSRNSCRESHASAVRSTSDDTFEDSVIAFSARTLAASRDDLSSAAFRSLLFTAVCSSKNVTLPLPLSSSSLHNASSSSSDNFKFSIAMNTRNSDWSRVPPWSVSICLKVARALAFPFPKYLHSASHAS